MNIIRKYSRIGKKYCLSVPLIVLFLVIFVLKYASLDDAARVFQLQPNLDFNNPRLLSISKRLSNNTPEIHQKSSPPTKMSPASTTRRKPIPTTTRAAARRIISEEEYYKPHPQVVNHFDYSYNLPPPSHICSGRPYVLILTNSGVDHWSRRSAIRASWGQVRLHPWWPPDIPLHVNISLGFVLGLSTNSTVQKVVEEESLLHRDIVQGTWIDNYKNMTYKSLLGLKFTADYCSHVPYLLKSDDDIFLHVPNMLDITTVIGEHTVVGRVWSNAKVRRDGKWSITLDEYPLDYFPPYEPGSAYIMTTDLALPMFNLSHYVPYIFIDDVYVTGILGKMLNIHHFNNFSKLFPIYPNTLQKQCEIFSTDTVAFHNFSEWELASLWTFMKTVTPDTKKCHIPSILRQRALFQLKFGDMKNQMILKNLSQQLMFTTLSSSRTPIIVPYS